MNLIEKIKKLTSKPDDSPELKRGEIKKILLENCNNFMPDFIFLEYKNSCYKFLRIREINTFKVYETLNIIFSLKERNFACSVSSVLNPKNISNSFYNNGIINPHIDLKVLKNNTGGLKLEDAYYFHNGKVKTTTKIVTEIFNDFKKYGLEFFNKQEEKLKRSEIIKEGFKFINNLTEDKTELKNSFTEDLKNGDYLLANIKNPIFIDLTVKLFSIKNLDKNEKGIIRKTANELLEIYWAEK